MSVWSNKPPPTQKVCERCGHSAVNPHAEAVCIEFLRSDREKDRRKRREDAEALAKLCELLDPVLSYMLERERELRIGEPTRDDVVSGKERA